MRPTEVSDATWANKLFRALWKSQHPAPLTEAVHWTQKPDEFWTQGRPPAHILAKAILEDVK